jgi:hypothetical protein
MRDACVILPLICAVAMTAYAGKFNSLTIVLLFTSWICTKLDRKP